MSTEPKRDYVEEVRNNLSEYISITKETQSRIAKGIGVSKAVLSMFCNDRYMGNNHELAKKIEQYINTGRARQAVAKIPDISLSVGNTIEILENTKIAHIYGEIALIYGPAGCGKSTTLRYYAQNTNGVVYVEADAVTNSPLSILQLILAELGKSAGGSTASAMARVISEFKDTNMLLIIDEAQHLTERAFDAIRAINDKAHIGIVYAGNPGILRRMFGRQEEKFDQVWSRVSRRCQLKNTYTLSDVTAIYDGYGFNKECLKYLQSISKRRGGLRLMTTQCRIAQDLAAAFNETFSPEHLEDAAVRMGIGGTNV